MPVVLAFPEGLAHVWELECVGEYFESVEVTLFGLHNFIYVKRIFFLQCFLNFGQVALVEQSVELRYYQHFWFVGGEDHPVEAWVLSEVMCQAGKQHSGFAAVRSACDDEHV